MHAVFIIVSDWVLIVTVNNVVWCAWCK